MTLTDQLAKLRRGQRLEYSAISGFNYYYLLPQKDEQKEMQIALHGQSDVSVYLILAEPRRKINIKSQINRYRHIILNPMPQKSFEWPVDLIHCNWDEEPSPKEQLYFVFPQRAFLRYQPIKKLLYQKKDSEVLDWRNPKVETVIRNFLAVIYSLHQSGYRYNDFNIERILYNEENGEILLRHTTAIRQKKNSEKFDEPTDIAIEFAPPFSCSETDYFSTAAMLFRLMIGRLPYEGKGLANYGTVFDPLRDREKDVLMHSNYFEHYHDYPCFIFDPDDSSNHLAPMQENDRPRDRWESLPNEIKQMFLNSLGNAEVSKRDKLVLYSPKQWLDALECYCWNKGEGGNCNE